MAKPTSTRFSLLGRLVKGFVGALLIPPVMGLVIGVISQLDEINAGAHTAAYWFVWGLAAYAGTHLLLYRPKHLFQLNHALLERLAVWLFGGQVATVGSEQPASSKRPPKAKPKKGRPAPEGGEAPQASTLVVISPYLVPLYTVIISLLAWVATHWGGGELFRIVTSLLLGISLGFHLSMTGEDLQQHIDQFPVEARLMALTFSTLASWVVAALCVPMALADFSLSGVLAQMASSTQAIYARVFGTLFFL